MDKSSRPDRRAVPTATGLGRASCPGLIAALSHNLLRWTTLIGLPDTTVPAARTLRRRLLTIPGRLAATGRRVTLRVPASWPWHTQFLAALARLRAAPSVS